MTHKVSETALVYPVVLCGGSGTRLWPLSRRSYPKQFSSLFEGETLFQRTLQRISGAGLAESYARIWVTPPDQAALVWAASVVSTPLVNLMPSMTLGN